MTCTSTAWRKNSASKPTGNSPDKTRKTIKNAPCQSWQGAFFQNNKKISNTLRSCRSAAADQRTGRKDQGATQHHLEGGPPERSLHITVLDPGD